MGIHGGSSQKCTGNMAFTPFSPQETLQEHIKHRNRHIWHFCSQEHLKALPEQLMSPSASTLCCAVLMKLHQHQHCLCHANETSVVLRVSPILHKKSLFHVICSLPRGLHWMVFQPIADLVFLQWTIKTECKIKANKYCNNKQ